MFKDNKGLPATMLLTLHVMLRVIFVSVAHAHDVRLNYAILLLSTTARLPVKALGLRFPSEIK